MSRKAIVNIKNPYENAFAKRIRDLLGGNNRFGKSITHEEIASVMGVTRQAVGQYYNGATYPTVDKIEKLADYFEVSTDYILGRTNIQSQDLDLKAICDKTGLSEKVVLGLVDFEKWLSYETGGDATELFIKSMMRESSYTREQVLLELKIVENDSMKKKKENISKIIEQSGVKCSDFVNKVFPSYITLEFFALLTIISRDHKENLGEDFFDYSIKNNGSVVLDGTTAVEFFSSQIADEIRSRLSSISLDFTEER